MSESFPYASPGLARTAMRSRTYVAGLLSTLWFAVALPAFAQPSDGGYPECKKTPTKSDSDAAHSKYLAGKVDYDEAKYEAAIAQFREAYIRDCTKHDLLIIISRAYELKGDKAEAIVALKTYLKRVPDDSPDVAAHRNRLENMEKAYAAQGNSRPSSTPPASAAPSSSAPPAAEEPETREHSVYPWLVVGAGGAAIAAGVIVHLLAPELPIECNRNQESCTRRPTDTDQTFRELQEEAGRAKDMPTWGTITIVGGAVVAAGGLLWHFLEPTGPVEKSAIPRFRPDVSPTYGGISIGGAL